jgi:hypothetical protein
MVEGCGKAPGQPMSSHRAEAFGKLAWINFLHHITMFYNITTRCSIQSYCDNKAIVQTTQTHHQYNRMSLAMCPNYDVLRTIAIKQQQLISASIRLGNTMYVKAHQDRNKKHHTLSPEERLNVRADELATLALSLTGDPEYILPHGMAFLSMDNAVISSNEQNILRWRYSEFKLQEYYSDKFGIKINNFSKINWAALRIAREKLHQGQKTFSIKHAIGWLATGNRMQMQGRILSACIQCGDNETTDHIYQCPQRVEKVTEIAQNFENFLHGINTHTSIAMALTTGLKCWVLITETQLATKDPDIIKAFQAQEEIGWHLLVRGFVATKWAEIQELRSDQIDSCIGDSWCSKVSAWWIQQSHELWIIRNKELHATDANKSTWKNNEIQEQVRKLYENEKYMC